MAKVGRNGPCPCGSGKKSKRCCSSHERISADAAARRALLDLRDGCHDDLIGVGSAAFDELYHAVCHLPELDISLQVRLPVLSDLVERARRELDADGDGDESDSDSFFATVEELADQLDCPERRLELGMAVLALRDAGRVPSKVAAVALCDLTADAPSALLRSSVIESIAVGSGHAPTPTGLVIAAA